VAVFMNLPYLLDNPDLIQPLLDCAYANLGWNSDIVFEMVTCVWEAMRLEADLRTLPAPTEEVRNKYAAIIAVVEVLAATSVVLLGQQLLLLQGIGLLLLVRVRSRAHLLPHLLLAAVSAAWSFTSRRAAASCRGSGASSGSSF
jgi:hypothetical protein